MRASKVENDVEKITNEYSEKLEAYARVVFEKEIKPYCDRRALNFKNGGAWGCMFSDRGTDSIMDEDLISKKIWDILNVETIGHFYLGQYMPDYVDGEFFNGK